MSSVTDVFKEAVGTIICALIIIAYLVMLVMYPSHPIPQRLEQLVYIAIGFLFNTGMKVTKMIAKTIA